MGLMVQRENHHTLRNRYSMGIPVQRPYHIDIMQTPLELQLVLQEREKLYFPMAQDISVLQRPLVIADRIIPNSIAVQPCEAFDAELDGKPSERTINRYKEFAAGGSGMIWFEGYAVGCEGRDSPHQLMLQKENIKANASLIRSMNEIAAKRFGIEHVPYKVLQITHSGRKTVDNQMQPHPITGSYNPFFDCKQQGELVLASDEYIEEQIERYIETAENALEAGFDGIDIKLAHGYFLSTLMNAFLRDGPYGGCFENRIRAIVSITDGIRKRCGDALHLCYRINAYDAVPYPHGWGMVKKCGMMQPDLSEPIKLLKILADKGLKIANISCSDSRFSPYHEGLYAKTKEIVPNQYQGEYALLDATRQMRQAVPSVRYVGTGMAWFEQFGANVAAGCMDEGWFDVAGFGRQALIDPAFAQKLLRGERPTVKQVCCLCDCCHRLSMQGYTQAGCIHEPTGYYAQLYRENVLRNEERK